MKDTALKLEPFALERFFAEYEFSVTYNMGPSDCETITINNLLSLSGTQAAENLGELALGYTESSGGHGLKTAVTGLYNDIKPEDLLIAAPQECIFLFLMSTVSKGGHVIVMTPSYQSLLSIPRAAGCEVSSVPVVEEGSGWTIDPDDLSGLIQQNTQCIIINTPHNPTGLVLDGEKRRRIIETARKHGIPVFCDEMYRGLEYGLAETPVSLCDDYENAVCLSGLSKAYGLPGLRIGWLVSRNRKYIGAAAGLKDYTTICNSAPSEFLAEIALRSGNRIIGNVMTIVRNNLDTVETFFKRYPGLLVMKYGTGGSTIFPRFRNTVSSMDIARRLAAKKDTLLVPGTLFDMDPVYFRIGLGRRDLPEALNRFGSFLEEEYGNP